MLTAAVDSSANAPPLSPSAASDNRVRMLRLEYIGFAFSFDVPFAKKGST
jgi:hypothetical protein